MEAPSRAKAFPAIIEKADLERYKSKLPKFAAPKITKILASENTMFYDEKVMKKMYQDTVGDGSYAPIGMRLNDSGKPIIVPEGKTMFSDDGKTWSFPFGHTAGTDDSKNITVINFLYLPSGAGGVLPIAYYIENDPSWSGKLGLHRWSWAFPVGAMFGEMIFVNYENEIYPVELRTRERRKKGWAANVFRPFPTAESLKNALVALGKKNAVLSTLEKTADLTAMSRKSEAFSKVMVAEGFTENLPDFADPELVKTLLTKTTFVSAYGGSWRKNDDKVTYAPTTKSAFSIVPQNYDAGYLEVSDESCKRCHERAQMMIQDLEKEKTGETQTILYGDMWGSDQIFSFNIFDNTKFNGAALGENRAVRPEFAQGSTVALFNRTTHTVNTYPATEKWSASADPGVTPVPSTVNPDSGTQTLAAARQAFMNSCGKCHQAPESDDRLKGQASIPQSMQVHAPADGADVSAIEKFLKSL